MADFRTEETHNLVLTVNGKKVEVPLTANLGQNADQFIGNDNPNGRPGQVTWRIKGQNDIAIENQGRVNLPGAMGSTRGAEIPKLQPSAVTRDNGLAFRVRKYLASQPDSGVDANTDLGVIERAILQRQTTGRSPLSELQTATDNIINEGLTKDQRSRILDGVSDPRFTEPDPENQPVVTNPTSLVDGIDAVSNLIPKTKSVKFDDSASPLCYPESLTELDQDHIKFETFRYASKSATSISDQTAGSSLLGNLGRVGGSKILSANSEGSVYLPISSMIQDQNSVKWDSEGINAIQAELFKFAYGAIGGSMTQQFNNQSDQIMSLLNNEGMTNEVKTAVQSYFAQRAAGVSNMLSRTSGAILNPNLTLLFNSPELRNFDFTFTMSARSDTEAANIKKIIRFFKQTMSVRLSTTELFLLAPNLYRIQYRSGGEVHKSIGRIKTCVLTNCSVNYTPDGSYMTFDDERKTMTSYQMTLRFAETEPVYYDDYAEQVSDLEEIGF